MRDNLDHGLFHPSQQYKARDGSMVERKVFYPPPVPTTMMGSVPNFPTCMLFFLATCRSDACQDLLSKQKLPCTAQIVF
ncbi:hypothetical protein DPMN_045813 [Dreissena polymorpha]|uniref:Uncharacterized protein n=1 Tax=Dreissena polymorpha TaxID=45954 RepID=A0A9D4I1Q3_DREPO|nr:hypothetical protein DPMN_045813 [Dreissena polymorpha]